MIRIVEVGPRDGLQNETASIPTEIKVAFVDALSGTGVSEIEVSAFVAPLRIPQLADAEEVFRRIRRRNGVLYSALVPNEKGLDRALQAGVDRISIFTSASETFNRKNINTSIHGSIRRFRPVLKRARDMGMPVRGYVSTAFWCAFEGAVPPRSVLDVVERLLDIGVEEIVISDTVGKANPEEVSRLLDMLLPGLPARRIAMHFHDTYGRAMENVLASLSRGIRIFDASAGGLGGCPYAPGATGNVATEAVVEGLRKAGEEVPADPQLLRRARRLLDPFLVEARRAIPKDGSPACLSCEFASTRESCCGGNGVPNSGM
jgi:hydroxymethylglutaryl-CoA lyase